MDSLKRQIREILENVNTCYGVALGHVAPVDATFLPRRIEIYVEYQSPFSRYKIVILGARVGLLIFPRSRHQVFKRTPSSCTRLRPRRKAGSYTLSFFNVTERPSKPKYAEITPR